MDAHEKTVSVDGLGDVRLRPLLGKHLDIAWGCEQTPPSPNAYQRLVSVACAHPTFTVAEAGELTLQQLLQLVDYALEMNEAKKTNTTPSD